jgi:hypothetical protein
MNSWPYTPLASPGGTKPSRTFALIAHDVRSSLLAGSPWYQAFHNYAVDWSPGLIVWTVDGQEYFRATPASLQAAKGNPRSSGSPSRPRATW